MYERSESGGVVCHVATRLREDADILVAFTERLGGVSASPYAELNLAAHVGDDAIAVDENRCRVFDALGLSGLRERLVTAEQVHRTNLAVVGTAEAGAGARAVGGAAPIAATDALLTSVPGVPLMLLYADCVPVVLVEPAARAIAVVHAGWRGAAAGIVGGAVARLTEATGGVQRILAFVGPHIGACCYRVGPEVVSHFGNRFVTLSRASAALDLAAVVSDDLGRAGVAEERQWHLGICTAHNTEHFYSYRAEGLTGRHAAIAAVLR